MEMINNDDDVSEKFKYRVVMITTGSYDRDHNHENMFTSTGQYVGDTK